MPRMTTGCVEKYVSKTGRGAGCYCGEAIVLVADSSFAALEFLAALRQLPKPVFVVSRLRLQRFSDE